MTTPTTTGLEPAVLPGRHTVPGRYGVSLAIAVLSAASFGLSGALARSLLDLGWSPAGVVAVRILGAFAVLLLACLVLLRPTTRPTAAQWRRMVAYGVVAVAGAQLCYFSAVQSLSVGVALLLEYLAPVLLIGWHWIRSGRRPAASVFLGAGLALLGLVFVLDLFSGLTLDPVGVLWGLGAAVCLCAYFVLAEGNDEGTAVAPLLMTTVGAGVGGVVILLVGVTGLLPLETRTGSTVLGGAEVGWWLPVLLLIGVTAVLAYLTGIVAVRRLGSSVASFVSLTEVIFAVVFAVILLSQQPTPTQLVGGALVLAGIAVVQRRRA